jgi:hypothetical protein
VIPESMSDTKTNFDIVLNLVCIRSLPKEVPLACRRGNDEILESS